MAMVQPTAARNLISSLFLICFVAAMFPYFRPLFQRSLFNLLKYNPHTFLCRIAIYLPLDQQITVGAIYTGDKYLSVIFLIVLLLRSPNTFAKWKKIIRRDTVTEYFHFYLLSLYLYFIALALRQFLLSKV